MSIRENIQLHGKLDIEKYLELLQAQVHPDQENAYVVDGTPFYKPQEVEDHIFILGFNNMLLPYSLIQILVDHPELISDSAVVNWTQEQDLILKDTVGNLRRKSQTPK